MTRLPSITGLLLLTVWFGCSPQAGSDTAAPAETTDETAPVELRTNVESAIAALDATRSGLAGTIGADQQVDGETFAQVCKPVGMQAKSIAQENGWMVRQVAIKYRNPDHAADPEAAALFPTFETDASVDSLWVRSEMDGAAGWRYLRRITVEQSCLACHGAEEARPDFIKEKYPDDRAFDFSEGDLRGLYSVFVADP